MEIDIKKEERNKKQREYREKNKKVLREKRIKYLSENKDVIKEKRKKYKDKNKEKIKEYQKEYFSNNREDINLYMRKYRQNIDSYKREKIKEITKTYFINNEIKIREYQKEYVEKNKIDIKNYQKEYNKSYKEKNKDIINKKSKEKRENDPLYKLTCNIRSLIFKSLKNKGFIKESRTYEILGCSYEDFKIYLESKFESWMNWDNYGNPKVGIFELNKTWDVDHIIPLSSATSEEEVIKLNHYTNLQPLCSYTNRFIKIDNLL